MRILFNQRMEIMVIIEELMYSIPIAITINPTIREIAFKPEAPRSLTM